MKGEEAGVSIVYCIYCVYNKDKEGLRKEQGKMSAELLKVGKKNATTTHDLCVLTGIDSVRGLRGAIARERKAGAVILSNPYGGYFLPGNKQEVEEFVKEQDRKARSIMVALQSARQYLRADENQISIEDLLKGESA